MSCARAYLTAFGSRGGRVIRLPRRRFFTGKMPRGDFSGGGAILELDTGLHASSGFSVHCTLYSQCSGCVGSSTTRWTTAYMSAQGVR